MPTDYGSELVYFKLERYGAADGGVKKYYSNKFLVTNQDIEYTARIDYLDRHRNIPLFDRDWETSSLP